MVTNAQRVRREVVSAWPLLEGAAAATLAWFIASQVVRHHQPFFAPIAAIVGLNTTTGERGSNVFRLLLGVFIGILVGELTTALLGGGYGRLALATLVAMTIARQLGAARIVIAQAASGAILTVAVAGGEAGPQRLGDALIGAGVVLLFTQVLFTPEPVGLIHRAAVASLREMGELLSLTARALRTDTSSAITGEMLASVRGLRERLEQLQQMMRAGGRIVRHSLYWRSRGDVVEREATAARRLELLGESLLMLTRSALAADPAGRAALAPVIDDLGGAIRSLAAASSDPERHERAAIDAIATAQRLAGSGQNQARAVAAARATAGMVAADLIAYLRAPAERAARGE